MNCNHCLDMDETLIAYSLQEFSLLAHQQLSQESFLLLQSLNTHFCYTAHWFGLKTSLPVL